MRLQFELEIAQNPVLGATALWQFSRAFFDTVGHTEGPDLPSTMLVLPMVFHRRTAAAIRRMRRSSGLWKALCEHPEIPAGLQLRVESSASLSLESLSFAVAGSLLELDRTDPWPRYTPILRNLPGEMSAAPEDVRQIIAASKRLGWWFANQDITTLCSRLHVRL